MKKAAAFLLLAFFLSGCQSVRESVNLEFKTEKDQLEPHQTRRAMADDLARD